MQTTKNHLGNIRVNYSLAKGSLVILDEHHYYPFGLEHGAYNPIRKEYRKAEDGGNNDIVVITEVENLGYQYKYNGKELQDELGLNWYDYGARNYMRDIGRWTTLDPLAEFAYSYSPNSYVFNNPIFFKDPTGMIAEAITDYYYDGKGNVVYDPNVYDPSDVPKGGRYIGPTYTDPETGTFWDEHGKPHSRTQEIDEVVVIGSASGGDGKRSYDKEFGIWGHSAGHNLARKGEADFTIDSRDFTGGGASVTGWLKFTKWLAGLFGRTQNIANKVIANKSTMEQKTEDEAKNVPPKIKVKLRRLNHANYTYKGRVYDGNYSNYDSLVHTSEDSLNVKQKNKKRNDSIRNLAREAYIHHHGN